MRSFIALLLPLLLASPASGLILANHAGATDPTTEGWTKANGGLGLGTTGSVFNDGASMLDAWSTDDDGSDSNLGFNQDLTPVLSTLASGWTYQVQLRVVDVPDPLDFGVSAQVETGGRAYLMTFGTNASGDVLVNLQGVGQVATITGGSNDYHLFEFIETDTSMIDLEFRIDGSFVTNYVGVASSRALAAWGDTSFSPGSGGQGNYARVTLTAVPEPGTALLLLGGLAICVSRRRLSLR